MVTGSTPVSRTEMKKIFFVRHGESEGNVGIRYQGPDSRLSSLGAEQALVIAKRCAKLPAECLISSTLNRAQQTAEIISHEISKNIDL